MKQKNANQVREKMVEVIKETLEQLNEDVGFIANNCLNIPVVAEDGEEGFVEILIRVPKDDDGFEKREDFELKQLEREEKARIAKELKAKKVARDEKRRSERKAQKEKEKAEKEEEE